MSRAVYIINYYENRRDSVQKNIAEKLVSANIPYVIMDSSVIEKPFTPAKLKNACISDAIAKGIRYLHIIEDDQIVADVTYFARMEELMKMLKIPLVFNSTTSVQNKVYGIHTPRLLASDTGNELVKDIVWNSYESKEYIGVDLENSNENFLYFDESLKYYYFLHNLWQRKHGDGSVKFLNFYPTIPNEEEFIYRNPEFPSSITPEIIQEARAEIAKTNLKWEPDQNINEVMNYIVENL